MELYRLRVGDRSRSSHGALSTRHLLESPFPFMSTGADSNVNIKRAPAWSTIPLARETLWFRLVWSYRRDKTAGGHFPVGKLGGRAIQRHHDKLLLPTGTLAQQTN